MLSRRIIRIKVFQILYAFQNSASKSLNQYEKELLHSLSKSYELYIYLIILIEEIVNLAREVVEIKRAKKIPSEEDLNPNTRFIDNRLVQMISSNKTIKLYLSRKGLSWVNYPELIRSLYNIISNSVGYKEYMNNNKSGFEEDKKYIIEIYKHIFYNFEPLYLNLEEQSIYWNDEIDFMINMICKTFSSFKETHAENARIMPLYKNTEDKDFAVRLFRKAAVNSEEYNEYIKLYLKNWELERIALTDTILIQLAIAEVIEFPSIPTKVTFNEYIELAKQYSTKKSSIFLNGLLDQVIGYLRDNKKFMKQGRGLLGEV